MIDLDVLNYDPDFPCHDGGRHNYKLSCDGRKAECCCGAEVLIEEITEEIES